MKRIFEYLVTCLAISLFLPACGDMYEIHDKYLKMGEDTYLGKPADLEADAGFKRIRLRWRLNADPRINSCRITWQGAEAPVVVPIEATSDGMHEATFDIPEGKYIFSITSHSQSGKESLPQTISGEVYGDAYKESINLNRRGCRSIVPSRDGATITWVPVDDCVSVKVTYVSSIDGSVKTIEQSASEPTLLIEDFISKGEFSVVSVFRPEENAIDLVESEPETFVFPIFYYVVSGEEWVGTEENPGLMSEYSQIPQASLAIDSFSTQEAVGEGSNGFAHCIIDGNFNTFWHSEWNNGARPVMPHTIVIDLGESKTISAILLARRLNNKDTKAVAFDMSEDKVEWTEAGAMDFPDSPTPVMRILVLPGKATGRYFRLKVTGSNNAPHASLSEVMLYQRL